MLHYIMLLVTGFITALCQCCKIELATTKFVISFVFWCLSVTV